MGQVVIAAFVALVLLGMFGQSSDNALKKAVGTILLWSIAGVVTIPIAFFILTRLGPFMLVVFLLFIAFRWLLSSSAGER